MFTGIVEELGVVNSLTRGNEAIKLVIAASKVAGDMKLGDSIAVNGVCLTVASFTPGEFIADVMPETLRKTNLSRLKVGDKVNLERALALGGRIGGHLVSGHVDGVGSITGKRREGNAWVYRFSTSPEVMRYIIPKGSVAVDGISLTVALAASDNFSVSVIPHTTAVTTLGARAVGDEVNLENDMIGKYVERLLQFSGGETRSGISLESLKDSGFIP